MPTITTGGALLDFLADTLASYQIGRFKLSMAWAFRICQTCLATTTSARTSFNSKAFQLRTIEQHMKQCDLVEEPTGNYYSTTYGISRGSCLLDIIYFNMRLGITTRCYVWLAWRYISVWAKASPLSLLWKEILFPLRVQQAFAIIWLWLWIYWNRRQATIHNLL